MGKRYKKPSLRVQLINKIILNLLGLSVTQVIIGCTFSVAMIYYGPFINIKEMLVTTAMTTLSHQYIVTTFLSDKEIQGIVNKNKIDDSVEKSDVQAITVAKVEDSVERDQGVKKDESVKFIDISTDKIKGYVLIVNDPKTISVATTDKVGRYGMQLEELVKAKVAVGGINAGGFSDEGGKGNGGIPQGVLIQDGRVITGNEKEVYSLIGFNEDSVLVLGKYTLQQAREKRIKCAVTFGPFLIVNGEPLIKTGNGGWGLAPRTAIGQTKEGEVILLVIDGRQFGSIGATLKDVQDIMQSFGAYNAANLDGGSSTIMVYKDRIVNSPCSQYGPRYLPSAFIIK